MDTSAYNRLMHATKKDKSIMLEKYEYVKYVDPASITSSADKLVVFVCIIEIVLYSSYECVCALLFWQVKMIFAFLSQTKPKNMTVS